MLTPGGYSTRRFFVLTPRGSLANMTSSARSFTLLGALVALLIFMTGCAATPNYLAPTGPSYAGDYATSTLSDDRLFSVATWNIKYSDNADVAIRVLQETPEFQNLDALLLQEMDENEVDRMARAMKWNYIYYPASIHPRHQRDFGEAILSPWPITEAQKLLLPHYSPRNGQIRLAVRARLIMPSFQPLVYTIHTETALMAPERRRQQVEALLVDAKATRGPVVIGGDFNTITPWERRTLASMMMQAGFDWATQNAGATVYKWGAGIGLDAIFAREMIVIEAAVIPAAQVSDHQPLWALLTPDSSEGFHR